MCDDNEFATRGLTLKSTDAVTVHRLSKKFRFFHRRPSGLKEQAVSWVRGERLAYEELWALRDVSLVVKQGEMVGVVGANGSGKSTLLQVISGIYAPDGGHIAVNGRLRALLELGTGFNPELSGRENVFLNGAFMGFPQAEIRKRFESIVEFAELARFIDMPLKTYSSGMQTRLGFAVAVHLDPQVLILDEVFAVGDDHFYRKCLRRIVDIRNAGASILFVSHALMTVEQMCDRVYLLEEGRIAAEGSASDVLSHYRASLAAGESKPVNVKRWGSGDVKIARVTVCGGDGAPSMVFSTGQPLTIRVEYEAPSRVVRPVFGVGIRRADGALVAGPNTKMSGYSIDAVEGVGVIEYRARSLPLIPGSYEVTVSVYDVELITAYDHWEQCAGFVVVEKGTGERFGVVVLDASWELHQAESV